MSIGTICKCDVVTITKDASIQEAAQLMKENNIGDVIVVETQEKLDKPIGIVTDRDIIIDVVADKKNAENIQVGDVMSENLLVLNNNQSIEDALKMMQEKGVRRAPIVSNEQKIVGIATFDDLFKLLVGEINSLAKLIEKQTAS